MSRPDGPDAAELTRTWLQRHPIAFTLIEDSQGPTAPVTVVEQHTGKQLRFAWGQVRQAERERSPQTGSAYLRVTLDDGRHFALAGIGFVFAPRFDATGPLAECPASASFRDFRKLHKHLAHLVKDHHEGHEREALQVLMVLLAFLDGARAVGLEVDEEERALDQILRRLEALGHSI